MRRWFEKTWPGKALDVVGGWLARLVGFSRRPPAEEPRDGMGAQQWFLCAGLVLMLCIPHFGWDNLYGVAFILAALLGAWRDAARHGRQILRPSSLGAGCWLFLLMCLLSTALAGNRVASARVALFYLAGFALAYAVACSFATESALDRLSGALYASLLLTALYGLYEFLWGHHESTVSIYTQLGTRLYYRLCSTLENPNNYGEAVAMLFPPSLAWALSRPRKGRRILFCALLAFPLMALLATLSRTGWVSLGLALLVWLCLGQRRLILPLLLAGAVLLLFLPEMLQERFLSIFRFDDASMSSRQTILADSLLLAKQHWLTGIGLGPENFQAAMAALPERLTAEIPPHTNSGYLQPLVEMGVLGLAGFLWLVADYLTRAYRGQREAVRPETRRYFRALLAALAGSAAAFLPEHVWFYPRVFFLWCVLAGMCFPAALAPRD